MRTRLTSAILIGLTLFLVGSLTPPAVADPWGTYDDKNGPQHPDGGHVTYCYYYVVEERRYTDPIGWAMNISVGDETDGQPLRHFDCDFRSRYGTDILFRMTNLKGTRRGQYHCIRFDKDKPKECDQAFVELDYPEVDRQEGDYMHNAKKTACHEVGHSLGLRHYNSTYWGCMVSGPLTSTTRSHLSYNADHKGHINAWF